MEEEMDMFGWGGGREDEPVFQDYEAARLQWEQPGVKASRFRRSRGRIAKLRKEKEECRRQEEEEERRGEALEVFRRRIRQSGGNVEELDRVVAALEYRRKRMEEEAVARKEGRWEEARLLGQEANPDQDGWCDVEERWIVALRDGINGVREELLERRRPVGWWSWRLAHSSRRHRRRHGDTTQVVTG